MNPVFFVNGYGIPRDILQDGNYGRYLNEVSGCIAATFTSLPAGMTAEVYLGGGPTNHNFPDRTEAEEMLRWFQQRGPNMGEKYHRITTSLDAQDNLIGLRERIGRQMPVTIFCEYARQDWVRWLAGRLFSHATILPVRFDIGRDMEQERQLQRRKLPLRMLGWYIPWVRSYIIVPQRQKFIQDWSSRTPHRP